MPLKFCWKVHGLSSHASAYFVSPDSYLAAKHYLAIVFPLTSQDFINMHSFLFLSGVTYVTSELQTSLGIS